MTPEALIDILKQHRLIEKFEDGSVAVMLGIKYPQLIAAMQSAATAGVVHHKADSASQPPDMLSIGEKWIKGWADYWRHRALVAEKQIAVPPQPAEGEWKTLQQDRGNWVVMCKNAWQSIRKWRNRFYEMQSISAGFEAENDALQAELTRLREEGRKR